MWKVCFSAGIAVASLPSLAAQPDWDQYGDVSVVWAETEGLARLHFSEFDDTTADSGCSKRAVEVVTVLSQQLNTPNGSDDLFRARASDKRVRDYRIPLNDAPRVITSWMGPLVQEGNVVEVTTVHCGQGGFIYASDIRLIR